MSAPSDISPLPPSRLTLGAAQKVALLEKNQDNEWSERSRTPVCAMQPLQTVPQRIQGRDRRAVHDAQRPVPPGRPAHYLHIDNHVVHLRRCDHPDVRSALPAVV